MNKHVTTISNLRKQRQDGIRKLVVFYNKKSHLVDDVKNNGKLLSKVNDKKQKFANLQTTLRVIQETTHNLDPFFTSLDLYAEKLKDLDDALHQ